MVDHQGTSSLADTSRERAPAESHTKTLRRGEACIICRRKKMRCDGQRPFCGQCSLTRRPEDCEYTDKQGRTNTEILEERFRQLKARIEELERRTHDAPILLHDPYAPHIPRSTLSSPLLLPVQSMPQAFPPQRLGDLSGSEVTDIEVDLSVLLHQNQAISYPGASSFQMALHITNLTRSATFPRDNLDYPHGALRAAISLWLGDTEEDSDDGTDLLTATRLERTIALLPDALASPNAMHRIQAIQAEVLLARFYFREGRLLEGHYHVSAAAAATLGSKLHQLGGLMEGTGINQLSTTTLVYRPTSLLGTGSLLDFPPPRDAVQLGEWIRLFWSVYALDQMWSVALDRPASIPAETVITTPLPLDIGEYEHLSIQQIISSGQNLNVYMSNLMNSDSMTRNISYSVNTAHSTASAFFGASTALIQLHTDSRNNEISVSAELLRGVADLDDKIRRFETSLRDWIQVFWSVEGDSARTSVVLRALSFARCLAHASLIQLHFALSQIPTGKIREELAAFQELDSYGCSLTAARSIAQILREDLGFGEGLRELGDVDFFMGVIWQSASRVLIDEAARIVSSSALHTSTENVVSQGRDGGGSDQTIVYESQARLYELDQDVSLFKYAMHELGNSCPLVAAQSDMLDVTQRR